MIYRLFRNWHIPENEILGMTIYSVDYKNKKVPYG